MIIETKYDIGHRFWVPRCVKRLREEEQEINDQVWVRQYYVYESYVKEKEIISIDVKCGKNGTSISYGILNIGEKYSELSQWYNESKIENYTKAEAKKLADKYAANYEEHFGSSDW